jgi:hypothetical protein
MTGVAVAVKIHLKIDAEYSHIVLEHMTEILKRVSELDRVGGKRQISSCFDLDYHPVMKGDLPSERAE